MDRHLYPLLLHLHLHVNHDLHHQDLHDLYQHHNLHLLRCRNRVEYHKSNLEYLLIYQATSKQSDPCGCGNFI